MTMHDALREAQFFDRHGNMKPNGYQEQSENPSLFNTVYYFSHLYFMTPKAFGVMEDVKERHKAKYMTNNSQWRTMEFDHNPSWSHDEKIAVLAFFAETGNKVWLDLVPFLGTREGNSSYLSYFRPDVFAFTMLTKFNNHWTRLAFRWIVNKKIDMSLKDFHKDPQGQSSGVQKAFVMLMGLRDTNAVKKIESQIREAINIYYPEEDHLIRRIWNERR